MAVRQINRKVKKFMIMGSANNNDRVELFEKFWKRKLADDIVKKGYRLVQEIKFKVMRADPLYYPEVDYMFAVWSYAYYVGKKKAKEKPKDFSLNRDG
jgi:hypothetical protein